MNDSSTRRVPTIAIAVTLGVLLVLLLAMFIYDHSRAEVISKGTRIGGVDVGGLTRAAALRKIQQDLVTRLNRPVTIHSATHTWKLDPRTAGLTVNADRMVSQALEASRQGSIFSRTFRDLFGGRVDKEIPLAVGYSHQAIRELTAKVRAAINRSAVNASVQPSASGLQLVAGRDGMAVESGVLASRVEHALTSPRSRHSVTVPTHRTAPAVSTDELSDRFPAYIIVDRSDFRLRFYQHLKLADTYEIAVGMQGLETPAGLYSIQWKQVDPPWYVPNSAWAGKLAGRVIPPGPDDPLKARFMSFDGGAGIHGIDPSEYGSIGHEASHGCVRMRIPDVISLYSRTPVGTPVYIT